jgi:peptide/nickel transport system permease protein
VFVVAVSLGIGVFVGTIAAYYGGALDEVLMRFTDIIIAFPGLILAMALVIAFPTLVPVNVSGILFLVSLFLVFAFAFERTGRRLMLPALILLCVTLGSVFYFPLEIRLNLTNLDKILVAITIVGWPGYARVIRGEIMRIKNEDYVEASRASGSSDFRIITKHILPNSIYPLVIVATLDIGSIVLSAAALSFLGIGASADYADWGQVISRSRAWITDANLMAKNFHTFFIPGLFITLFVVGWNLLGDALRDVLDPMLRRR